MSQHVLIVTVLVLVNLVSAVAVVKVKHDSREMRHEVQVLRVRQDNLKVSWAQLRLEDSTWGNYDRVRRLAGERLDMRLPRHYIVLEPQS